MNKMNRRVMSFLLVLAMFVSLIPSNVFTVFAAYEVTGGDTTGTTEQETAKNEYEANVGKQAIFDWWGSFAVAPDVDSKPGEYSTIDDEVLGVNELIVTIVDYYYDDVLGEHWYKVAAREGETLAQALNDNPWVYYETDGDEIDGIDPSLCIYDEDAVIRFVSSKVVEYEYAKDENGEILKDDNGDPVIDLTTTHYKNYVVSGPSALENAKIEIERIDNYQISALAYMETTFNTVFSQGYSISITKEDGNVWTSADGTVAIRYERTQFGDNSYTADNEFGAAYLYVGDTVYSAEATELWGFEASDVVYTDNGNSVLVFEIMDPSFSLVNSYGYFSTGTVALYKNDLMTRKEYMSSELPEFVYVAYSFTQTLYSTDDNGDTVIQEKEWYWLSNGSEYFFVPKNQITLYSNDNITEEAEEAHEKLMQTDTLASYEAVLESIGDAVWENLKHTSLGVEVIVHSYLLTYDHYYSAVSEAEYNAIKAKYPKAYHYIQADEELKYFNDLILERVKYLDQHPEERYMQFGEIEYVDLPSYTNVAPLVRPTVEVPVPARSFVTPFALRNAATRATDDDAANGVLLDKDVSGPDANGNYTVRLEAYTTGSTVTTVTEKEMPVDIVLVLDLSSSMVSGHMDAIGYQQITSATAAQGYQYGMDEKLLVKIGDEYREVSVIGTNPTTTEPPQYTGGRTAAELYKNKDNLYYKHTDGEYYKVTVSRGGTGKNRNYTFYYTVNRTNYYIARTVLGTASIEAETFYTDDEAVTVYESYQFSYLGANNQTVTKTYNPTDSIVGGDNPEYYTTYANGQITRAEALINAITNFTNQVAQKAAGKDGDITTTHDNVNHTIAIAGYNTAGSSTTGIYIGNEVNVWSNTNSITQEEYATALQAMDTQTGVDNIKASIEKLKTSNASGTNTFAGVSMAHSILQANPQANDPDRNQVVVVFTDGQPYGRQTINGTTYTPENAGIYHAKQIKDMGATVYSVGILDGGNAAIPPSGSINVFMHGMSSNYKNATSTSNLGDLTNEKYYEDGSNYYLLASNAEDLNNIFTSISNSATSGGSITDLSTSTQIRDIISPYFMLPENADIDSIELYTADYTGVGENPWKTPEKLTNATPTISADRKIIGVTGFDYKEHWVGTETAANGTVTYHGKKLIIEFPIVVDPDFLGGTGAVTNGDMSGIYADENATTPIEKFEVPDVDVALREISTVVDNKYIYLGNTADLTEILNLYVKRNDQQADLKVTVDGINNAYVNLQYTITLDNNTVAVYTIPAGMKWEDGTWELNKGDLLQNYQALVDTDFAVTCVMTDAAAPNNQSPAEGSATVYVYKPTITFKDSEQTYKKPLNPASDFLNSHFVGAVWTHPTQTITPEGTAPTLSFEYSYEPTNAFDNGVMNATKDVPVKVTVTIDGTGTDIVGNDHVTFVHANCDHDGCDFDSKTEQFIVHVIGALTSLTIQKQGWNALDPNQTYLFRVTGRDADGRPINVVVTVHEKGSVTIDGLVIGNKYTVTELTDWSWRYAFSSWSVSGATSDDNTSENGAEIKLGETGNVIIFENTREQLQWLDGDAWCDNRFYTVTTASSDDEDEEA